MITIQDLAVGYNGNKIGPYINGHIDKGSMTAVTGPNGIGKSTFLKTLAGLLPPANGRLEFKIKKNSISYLPQRNNIDYTLPVTVFDVVSMGCWPRIGFFTGLNDYQKCLIYQALEQVKLFNLLHRFVNNLSGGQIQRMLFARMLVQRASLVLLDEPFQNVDQFTCEILMRAVIQLHKYGSTIIVVLHDNKFVSKYFTNILLLNQAFSIWKYL